MRRSVFIALMVVCLATAALGSDWPQFLGPNRNGVSPEKGLMRKWPAGGPKVLWTIDVGPGYGGAAIRDGKVYILDRIGDEQDVLRVLDVATGKEEWRFAYDASGRASHHGSRSTPTVGDKYVFTVGLFGHFHCIDKATHKPVWTKHLLKDYGGKRPQWAVAQSPLLYKEVVIAAPQSGSVGVIAYEKATGKERWRSEPFGSMYYHSPFVTTVGGVEQIIMQSTRNVVGLDPANGKVLWTYGFRVPVAGIPAPTPLGQDRFFLTGGYEAGSEIIEVARQGGGLAAKRLHRFEEIGSHIQQPILYEGHVYVVCNTNRRANGMVCFGLDGQVKWKTGRHPYLCKGNTLMTGDGVFYQLDGREGDLHIVEPSPDGFKSVGKVKLLGGKEIWGPMSLSDGRLVIRDQRQMKCLDIRAQ